MYQFTSFLRKFKSSLLECNCIHFVLRTCQEAGFYPDVHHRMHPPGSWFVWLADHTIVILSEIFINLVPKNPGRLMFAANSLDHHGQYKLRLCAFHVVHHDGSLHYPYFYVNCVKSCGNYMNSCVVKLSNSAFFFRHSAHNILPVSFVCVIS